MADVIPGYPLVWSDEMEKSSFRLGNSDIEQANSPGIWNTKPWYGEPHGTIGYGVDYFWNPGFRPVPAGYREDGPFYYENGKLQIRAIRKAQMPASVQPMVPKGWDGKKELTWVSGLAGTFYSVRVKPPFVMGFRGRMSPGRGLWGAVWTIGGERSGTNGNARRGEIDIEFFNANEGAKNTGVMCAIHWDEDDVGGGPYHAIQEHVQLGFNYTEASHEYFVEVLETEVKWWVDGRLIKTIAYPPSAYPAMQSWHQIIMNLAVIGPDIAVGQPGGWARSWDDGTTPSPSFLEIEWIRLGVPASNSNVRLPAGSVPPPPPQPPTPSPDPVPVPQPTPAPPAPKPSKPDKPKKGRSWKRFFDDMLRGLGMKFT